MGESEARLAWFQFYDDVATGRRAVNYSISASPVPTESLDQIRKILADVSKLRPLLTYFDIFCRNFADLESSLTQVQADLEVGKYAESDEVTIDHQLLLQQRLVNFLNSAVLMVERTTSFVAAGDKGKLEKLKKLLRKVHSAHASYQFWAIVYLTNPW